LFVADRDRRGFSIATARSRLLKGYRIEGVDV
jgi:hypothetical protein